MSEHATSTTAAFTRPPTWAEVLAEEIRAYKREAARAQ